jgi:hypothetical protein
MAAAEYDRKQAQVFARMASSAIARESADRYRAFALDYLAKAEKLEPSTGTVVSAPAHGDNTSYTDNAAGDS